MSNPGFYFYPGDWFKDTKILSLQSRGAWIDLICELYEHGGSITWTVPELAHFLGCDENACHAVVTELSRHNTGSVTLDVTGDVTIMSRRVTRELKARENARLRKAKERERQARHRNVTQDVTPLSSASSSLNPSPSLSSPKKELPIEIPDWIPSGPWEAYLRHRKHKRVKVTPEAAQGLMEKLATLKTQGEDISAVLKQSVTNGWTGLFPVSGNGRGKPELPSSQVPKAPTHKLAPTERRADPEIREGLRKLVSELTEKMAGKV